MVMLMADDQAPEENETTEEGAEGEEGAKKSGSKLIIIIVLALVLIGGAGAGAFFFISSGDKAPEGEHAEAAEGHGEAPAESGGHGESAGGEKEKSGGGGGHGGGEGGAGIVQAHFYEMPEILVNLASTGNANRYLKLKVNLEVNSEADLATLQAIMPRIEDDFRIYLMQLRVEDLRGSAGIYRLKEALLLRANQSAQPLEISNVLFKEILVQ